MSAEKSTPPATVPTTHPPSTPSHADEPLTKRPKPTPTASFDLSADKPSVDLSQIPAFKMTSTSAPAPSLLIKKLSPKGRAPTRGSAFAAGYDVYASEETVVPSKGKALVSTGIAMAIPGGCYGRVAPRSGLAVKSFIDTGAGVIDSDYRGELKILLFNHSAVDFKVTEGDRVAQLILERIYTPEVEVVEELEESVRGAGGFGSTGVGLVKTI